MVWMTKINCPEDITKLRWVGNYGADAPLFKLVDDYLKREPDRLKRYEAERLVHKLGMGIILPEQPPDDFM